MTEGPFYCKYNQQGRDTTGTLLHTALTFSNVSNVWIEAGFHLSVSLVKNLSPYHALTIFVSVIHSGVAVYTGKETKVRLPNLSLSNKTN